MSPQSTAGLAKSREHAAHGHIRAMLMRVRVSVTGRPEIGNRVAVSKCRIGTRRSAFPDIATAILAGLRAAAYLSRRADDGVLVLKSASEPIFNVPTVVAATVAVLAFIEAIQEFILPESANVALLAWFAFIPARYDPTPLVHGAYPGGIAADVWTFVTYALLHGNWLHLGLNAVWLLAFGTPVARRFGATRFLGLFAVAAAAGAVAHLVTHAGDPAPMVGASAAISGFMAAAIRFIFQPGGPLDLWSGRERIPHLVPAAPLFVAVRDPRILAFLAIWFGLNLLFGMGSLAILGSGQPIAWQAHVGGFLAGLLAFRAFDPMGPLPRVGSETQSEPPAQTTPSQN
jgi:membrane associated rhomboid family serine protease